MLFLGLFSDIVTTAEVIQYQLNNYRLTICDEQKRILKELAEAQCIMCFVSVCLKGPRKTVKDLS